MNQIAPEAGKALALARSGDIPGAIAAGERALAGGLADPGLAMFIGMLCGRQGDLARGVGHFRRAVELAPREPAAKVELARALVATGAYDEAEAVAAPLASSASPAGREMQRIQAHCLFRTGKAAEAEILFEALVAADEADFESWGGLGAARLAADDPHGAIIALRRAVELKPTAQLSWTNLSRAHTAAGEFAYGVEAAQAALACGPGDAAANLELGRSLAGLDRHDEALLALAAARNGVLDNAPVLTEIGDIEFTCKAPEQAGVSYQAALRVEPDLAIALLGYGKILERLNRPVELHALLDDAEARGVTSGATALLRAMALRAEGKLEAALATAHRADRELDPVARAQLIGDIADRLGQPDVAFAAFSEANDLLAEKSLGLAEAAATYLDTFKRIGDLMTEAWYRGWSPAAPADDRPGPLFIFGFPRSGTTLIDTMLSGHPDTVVIEEGPTIDRTADALGPVERVATLTDDDIARLRDVYFAEVEKLVPDIGGRLIIDKNPLGLGNAPLLHRLFPDARFVFVERHPCDVVLSCFITSSRMNAKIASFFSFTGTARLYDRVLSFWMRVRETLPIRLHTIRYEALIADPETELRKLAEFAGLAWDPALLANEANAVARGYIGSPSYAQVAEPLYTRARGRWHRYRQHMADVLPILTPWAERLGYDLEP